MSAIRSMALLAGMAFCSAAWAQEGFFIYSKAGSGGKYVNETLIAKCSVDKNKPDEYRCSLTKPNPERFDTSKHKLTQLPDVMTFVQVNNPCWCKVDAGALVCVPTPCR